jgi:NodT family efflux transporter outer membrane factor (OMF) lipoprotein
MMFAALSLLLLSGCLVKRDKYDVPVLNLPAKYPKATTAVDAPHTLNIPPPPSAASSLLLNAKLTEWWRLLDSQELNSLMDRALANNPDLRISTLRIAQSKTRLNQAGAGKVPTVSMPIQSSTTHPEYGAGSGNSNANNTSRTLHQLSLKGDWRPDIWGESAALYESAELQLLRATYQRDDMQRNVVANVVVAYIEYLSLNDRLRVARETEKSLSEMLASVDGRLKVGDATITEMEQQKAAVYSVKATIPVLGQQREIVLNRLASLLGSAPVALKLSHSGLNSVKFPQVLPDMPSALLLRRPDVRATESRLLSADADIDVARARILPPLDLTAQVGYGSIYMSQLFLPQALFWTTIANLSVTIFDAGKRFKEVEFARAVHEELLETYVRVIYDAVREVDDALSALNYTGKRLEAQELAADSSLRAWNYSQETFMAGAVDYLVLLDTQRTYQRNLDDWYNVRIDRYRSLVNLFSALGGGIPNNDASPTGELHFQSLNKELATTSSRKTEQANKNQDEANKPGSIDWTGRLLENEKTNWLVELSGVYDGGAVLPAWRDLSTRFPREIGNYYLLPQRQGQIIVRDKERSSWYRLFVARFPDRQIAEEFCAILRAGQQRCTVVSSESIDGKGDFVAPATFAQPISSATWDDLAVKTIKQ